MKHRGFFGTFVVLFMKFTMLLVAITMLGFLLMGVADVLAEESYSFIEWLVMIQVILPLMVLLAVGFGLLFGLLNAFNYKASTMSVSFQDKDAFLHRLDTAINKLGFSLETQDQNTVIYKRTAFQEKLMNPSISVQIEQNHATIVGPALYIKRLQGKIQ